MHYPAWIVFAPGQSPYRCMLFDISASGARIQFDDNLKPPIEFTLLMSAKGKRRNCRVIWRDQESVGVEFLT